MDRFEYDVFLSYNAIDEAWVRRLHERLIHHESSYGQLRVFFAHESLRPGALITRDLSAALSASAKVVVIMSPEWMASEWTTFEASIELHRDPAARLQRLIPLVLRSCEPPPELTRLRSIDVRSESNFDRAFEELVSALEEGRRTAFLEDAAKRERERVLNSAVLPWTPQGSPSFGFLWPDRFIDSRIRTHKKPGPPTRFNAWERDNHELGAVALVGDPGGGKSTILRSLFLRDDSVYSPQHNVSYITAADLMTGKGTVHETAERAPHGAGLVLLDGVDEVGSSNIEPIMNYVLQLRDRGIRVRMACRADFYFRHIAMREDWHSAFDEVLEILEWTIEDAQEFARWYADQVDEPQLFNQANDMLTRIPTATSLWRNPLQMTLLLYLLHSKVDISEQELSYPYELYSAVYRHWQGRERHRGTGQSSTIAIEAAHLAVAKTLEATRGEEPPRLRDVIASVVGDSLDGVLEDTAFRGLLMTRLDHEGIEVAVSFRHETFAEFLISRSVIVAFERGGYAIDNALSATYGSHINRFVRSGLEYRASLSSSRILGNLVARYDDLKREGGDECALDDGTDKAITDLREQLVYYIGRLPSAEALEFLRRAYAEESVRIIGRSAALGAIIHGDDEIERDYLGKLRADPEEELLNRSAQLIYFVDRKGDFHSYRDSGVGPWRRTRDHIFERLLASGDREMRLRWWDMKTLLYFFRSRPEDRLNESELEVLARMECGDIETDRGQKIAAVRDLIVESASPIRTL